MNMTGSACPRLSVRAALRTNMARPGFVRLPAEVVACGCVTLILLSGCAAAFSELPAERRDETCAFLSHRAQQGDFLACSLAAQRAVAKQAGFSDPVSPRFGVTAEVIYSEDGTPVRVAALHSDVPGENGDAVTGCYRSALSSSAIPGTGVKVRVPIRFRFDTLGQEAPAAGLGREARRGGEPFAGCLVDVVGDAP